MKREEEMKIISFVGIKGGIGKTSLCKNFLSKISKRLKETGSDKKVLAIDLDHQCNLTQSNGIYESDGTVVNIFKRTGDVNIHHVSENIDLIAGAMDLDIIESELETKAYKDMLLYMWLDKHYDDLDLDQYEYVLIDCRPDFSIATRNAITVSHLLISPIIPSKYSLTARVNIENRLRLYSEENIDYKTGESNIDAELYYVGNMIKHNTRSSQDLVEDLKDDERVLGFVPHKELFNRSTLLVSDTGVQPSVYDLVESDERLKRENREFIKQLDEVFDRILEKVDVVA